MNRGLSQEWHCDLPSFDQRGPVLRSSSSCNLELKQVLKSLSPVGDVCSQHVTVFGACEFVREQSLRTTEDSH